MKKHIKLICATLIAAVLLASSGCAHIDAQPDSLGHAVAVRIA